MGEIMKPRITLITLGVDDLEKSLSFYRDGLGFQVIGPRHPDGPSTDLTDQTLNITILPFVGDPPNPPIEGNEQIHFGILVPDAAALYRHLRALGATIVRDDIKVRGEPRDDEAPAGSYKIVDPDGNVIDVTDSPTEWRGISATT